MRAVVSVGLQESPADVIERGRPGVVVLSVAELEGADLELSRRSAVDVASHRVIPAEPDVRIRR